MSRVSFRGGNPTNPSDDNFLIGMSDDVPSPEMSFGSSVSPSPRTQAPTVATNEVVPTDVAPDPPPSHVSAGLHINLIADASVANAPSTFVSEIRQAADILEANFSDPITVNIRYGWGTYNNQTDARLIGGSFAEGGDLGGQNVTYATLKSWLTADASSAQDNTAVAHLPGTLANNFHVSTSQLKALGHFSGNANDVDGAIGWGTGWTSNFVGGALHELTHAMGRIFQDGFHYVMDLFRFDALGHFQWTGRQPAYFSIDGGNTKLADFGVNTDFGDFKPGGVQGPDPFNESVSGNNTLTAVDITNMDVIGFNLATGTAPPTHDDFANTLTDLTHPFGTIGVTGTATGTLEVSGDHDWFRVQLTAGTSYLINLQGQQAGAGTLEDPYLRVRNSAGTLVAENDDIVSGTNRDSQLTYVAPATGTYYLDLGAFNESYAGTYRITLSVSSDDFANSLTDAAHPFGQVAVNGTGTGRLEVAGDRDWFRVQLVAGTTYLIDLQGEHAGVGTLEDPYLRVHNSTGALTAENDDIVLGINRDSQLTLQVATTGAYYLEVGAFDDNYVGTYRVGVSTTTTNDDFRDSLTDTTLPFGQAVVGGSRTGDLEVEGDRDWFQVQLTAGTSYRIDLQGQQAGAGTLEDPYLRLHDSGGALVAENDDIDLGIHRDSQLNFTASVTGTYYLEAGSFADGYTGTYRLTVAAGAPAVHVLATVDIGLHPAGYGVAGIGDFNHDGTSDVLWYNPTTRDTDIWSLNNGHWAGSSTIGLHPPGYDIAGIADFNNDGTSDVLWFNPTTRDTDIWTVINGHWAASNTIGLHPAGYQIAGLGDFNHDGSVDVLWYNPTTTDTDIWLLNNGHWTASTTIGLHPPGYQIAGIGDFNHDGTSDVLWFNPTTRDTDIWTVNNGHWAGSSTIGLHPAGYQIAGTGDFNQDGTSDVVWSGLSNNDIDVWLVNNGHWAGSAGLGTHAAGWSPAGIGDFDKNGTSDVMWHENATNHMETWLTAYS